MKKYAANAYTDHEHRLDLYRSAETMDRIKKMGFKLWLKIVEAQKVQK